MSVYKLLTNATVVNTTLPPNPLIQMPGPENPNMPPREQQFQIVLSGAGNCSCTVQHYGSNDGENCVAYGDPITVTGTDLGGSTVAQGSMTGNAPWHRIGAVVTEISGTNASVSDTMVAG
jgi:hypothetical protein